MINIHHTKPPVGEDNFMTFEEMEKSIEKIGYKYLKERLEPIITGFCLALLFYLFMFLCAGLSWLFN